MKHAWHFRTLTATARAAATGLTNVALGRIEPTDVELRPGDLAPDFDAAGVRWPRVQAQRFPRPAGGGDRVVSQGVHAWMHRGVPIARRERSRVARIERAVFRGERRFAGHECGVRRGRSSLPYPILSDETRETARAYGVLTASGFPSRWTFYIGLDGRILDIDQQVHVSTHGHDVAARLRDLGIS